MHSAAEFLIAIGGILLIGLMTDAIGRHTFLPRVTLLIIFGALIGSEMLDIIPTIISDRFEIIANMTLLLVGFLLGGKLTMELLKRSAKNVLWISICAAIVTAVIVSGGLIAVGVAKEIAILFGCIASATAPAAIVDVVIEYKHKGPFSNCLLSIVALDDAWALIIFSLGVSGVAAWMGLDGGISPLVIAFKEVGGAILLGILIGFPAAYVTGRIKPGQPMLTEALGIVFFCGGIAIWMDVSFLIASMVMGCVVANFAKHHEYPFHEIEGIEWPFMVIFFVLAGASLDFSALWAVGLIGLMYIFCRAIGKYTGAWIGGELSNSDKQTTRWIGLALLPQAGVAIGMALVAANYFPEYRQTLLTVVIGSTVFFEIIGPVLTRLALDHAHNA